MPMTYHAKSDYYSKLPASVGPTSYLEDYMTSETDTDHQITSGFFKQVEGDALVYTYTYDEMKVVLEVVGDVTITDETGTTTTPKRGDVYYFKKGCTITFKATGEGSYGYFFYCGQKANGVL